MLLLVNNDRVRINHLYYADDTLIFINLVVFLGVIRTESGATRFLDG